MTAMNEMAAKAGQEVITLDGQHFGQWKQSHDFTVTREGLAAYAAATGDTREARLAGDEGGPCFAFVPYTDLLFAAIAQLGGDVLNGRLVHTHQEFRFGKAIHAGDTLSVHAHISAMYDGPFGAVMQMTAVTERDGVQINEQVATCLVAATTVVNPIGAPAAAAELREGRRPAGKTAAVAIAEDQAVRYADASGDHNPIHLDPAAAREIGFPTTIVHGMCTLALSVAAIEATHPETTGVASLKIEFTRPVFPRDRLTVRWTEEKDDDGRLVASFDVVNRKQRTVMRGGSVTLLP